MGSQSQTPSRVTLRPVSADDHDFLVEVYASTRAEEMALVPWTNEQRHAFILSQFTAQQTHYGNKYPDASHDVIMSGGKPVGRLYVARLEEEIRIVDITILPAERNSRIGSHLLEQLLEEARSTGKVIRIYVEEFNPSSRLFERLGFKLRDQHGIHQLMEWTPNKGCEQESN